MFEPKSWKWKIGLCICFFIDVIYQSKVGMSFLYVAILDIY